MRISKQELKTILSYVDQLRQKKQLLTPALSKALQEKTGIIEPSDAASVMAYLEMGEWYMNGLNAIKSDSRPISPPMIPQ